VSKGPSSKNGNFLILNYNPQIQVRIFPNERLVGNPNIDSECDPSKIWSKAINLGLGLTASRDFFEWFVFVGLRASKTAPRTDRI